MRRLHGWRRDLAATRNARTTTARQRRRKRRSMERAERDIAAFLEGRNAIGMYFSREATP